MDFRKAFAVSLVVNLVLLGAVVFFRSDRAQLAEMNASLENEWHEAIAANEKLKEESAVLRNRLESQAQSSNAGGDYERLKTVVDEKDAEITRLKKQLEARNAAGGPGAFGGMRGGFREQMERLRETQPELYGRMESQMEKMRQDMARRSEMRDKYLDEIKTVKLNAQQRHALEEYKALAKESAEQMDAIANGGLEDMEAMGKVMINRMNMERLSGQIRDILLEQYAGSAASDVKNIIEATTVDRVMPGGFGGGPGGPGPGPGGPGM